MSIQTIASLISFSGIAGMIGIYWFVWSHAQEEEPYPEVQSRAYDLRKWLFAGALVGFFVVPAFTLRSMPYSMASQLTEPIVVSVTGAQWNWTLSHEQLPANSPIVFRVESADVNHGFAIYNSADRLIAQVQVMPGYVNELAVEFDAPGTYRVLCLEYCGLAHHTMAATIEVVAADALEERV